MAKKRARPTTPLNIRVTRPLLRAIDRYRSVLSERNPSQAYTRADAVRALLHKAIYPRR